MTRTGRSAGKKMRLMAISLAALVAVSSLVAGCNMFGSIDDPSTRAELLLDAKNRMDDGDYTGAVAILESIADKDDEVYNTLGWAQMGAAGAPFLKIGSSIMNYNPDSTSTLNVVGQLANSLLPIQSNMMANISAAYTTFGLVENENTKKFGQAIAKFVQAAAKIAEQAGTATEVQKSQIAAAACYSTPRTFEDCGTLPPSCNNVGAGMDDTEVGDFITLIGEAGTALGGGSESTFGVLKELIDQFGGLGAIAGRCVIANLVVE